MTGLGDQELSQVVERERLRLSDDHDRIGLSPCQAKRSHDLVRAPLAAVTETGYSGTPDEMVAQGLASTGGFAQVLCALKALLEHDIERHIVRDHLEAVGG